LPFSVVFSMFCIRVFCIRVFEKFLDDPYYEPLPWFVVLKWFSHTVPRCICTYVSSSYICNKCIVTITYGLIALWYHVCEIIWGENFCSFHGFFLMANVLPLKIFLEYQHHPLTTQSMVPPGLKFATAKVFPTYLALVINCESFPP